MRMEAKQCFALKSNKEPASIRSQITDILLALDSYPSPEEEKALNKAFVAIVSSATK